MTGGGAQLFDLGVGVVKRDGRALDQRGDVDLLETRHQLSRVALGDDQIRLVARDRLHVGREAGQIRRRRLLRVVRELVHRDHLVTGADREQHLGRGRRQRNDALGQCRDLDGRCARADGDREDRLVGGLLHVALIIGRVGLLLRLVRRRRGVRFVVTAAGADEDGGQCDGSPFGRVFHESASSIAQEEERRRRGFRRTNGPSSEDGFVATRQAAWLRITA